MANGICGHTNASGQNDCSEPCAWSRSGKTRYPYCERHRKEFFAQRGCVHRVPPEKRDLLVISFVDRVLVRHAGHSEAVKDFWTFDVFENGYPETRTLEFYRGLYDVVEIGEEAQQMQGQSRQTLQLSLRE